MTEHAPTDQPWMQTEDVRKAKLAALPPMRIGTPRRFRLVRAHDITGVSGTGTVATGCQFGDGTCALRWNSAVASTALYDRIDDVITIHGHNGTTTIVWIDS